MHSIHLKLLQIESYALNFSIRFIFLHHQFIRIHLSYCTHWTIVFDFRLTVMWMRFFFLSCASISFTFFSFHRFIFGAAMSTVNSRNCFPRFEYYMVLLMTRIPNKSPLQSMYLVGLQSSKTFDWHILYFSVSILFFCFTSCFDIFHVFGLHEAGGHVVRHDYQNRIWISQ